MKRLHLVRHAKSSWSKPALADIDRPLNDRGRRDAPDMGRRLAERDVRPDVIVSSPARRAMATARALAEAMMFDPDRIEPEPRIYGAGTRELLEVVHSFDDRFNVVMLVGHNPGFTDLASDLGQKRILNVPTCGVVSFEFDVERWVEAERENATLTDFDTPKGFRQGR